MPDNTLTTSQVLDRAADLIEERGWASGHCSMDAVPGAPLCIEGALAVALDAPLMKSASGWQYSYPDVQDSAPYPVIREYVGQPNWVWQWNDARGRTADEVIEVLRACALLEASREASRESVSA